mgnify:CR=1 FL=1
MVNAELQDDLRKEAQRLGFVACGFTSAAPDPQRAARLEEYLGEGRHGSMEWMEARKAQRASPQGLWPEARSVIALGMSYAPDIDPLALESHPEKARVSVYAQGRDYHDVVKKALKALARWLIERAPESELKVFVDTAPVMEKPLGEAAGIGWQGTVALFGLPEEPKIEFDYVGLMRRQPVIIANVSSSSDDPTSCIKDTVALVEQGALDVSWLVTHRMPFEEAPKAYEMYESYQEEIIKVVLTV